MYLDRTRSGLLDRHGDYTTEEDYDVSTTVDGIVSEARERFEERERARQSQIEEQGQGKDVEMA